MIGKSWNVFRGPYIWTGVCVYFSARPIGNVSSSTTCRSRREGRMNCGVRTGNRYIAGPHSLLARVTQFLPTRVYLGSIFGGLKGAPDNSHLVPAPLTGRFPSTRYLGDVPRTLSELEFVFLMCWNL
mgnify:CR=1 FL=1